MLRNALFLFLLAPVPALAQQLVCADVYTHQQWRKDLEAAERSIGAFDIDGSKVALKKTHQALQCLEGIAKPSYLARLGRDLSIVFFLQQDESATLRWAAASERAFPGMPWPPDLGPDHPMREQLADADPPTIVVDEEHGFVVPAKGAVFVNGRPATKLEAAVETPMFVQIADGKGGVVDQYWQDGAAWPERVLGPPGPAPSVPRWFVPEDPATAAFHEGPMFGDTAVAAAEPEPEEEETSYLTVFPADYVDPFEDARLRAIRHEATVREGLDRRTGTVVSVRTEVTTFALDTKPPKAVTYAEYADFLHYAPEFVKKDAVSAGQADKRYLKDWARGVAPPEKASEPVVWVSFNAAKAYCDLWAGGLAPSSIVEPAPVVDEWRQDGATPVVRTVSGEVKPAVDLTATSATRGFRCVK